MKSQTNYESFLKLTDMYFSKIDFRRGNQQVKLDELSFGLSIQLTGNKETGDYTMLFGTQFSAESNEDFKLDLELKGDFQIPPSLEIEDDLKEKILKKNTLAIMFPYMRSQITLMTSQPGMEPFILPPMNINAIVEDEE